MKFLLAIIAALTLVACSDDSGTSSGGGGIADNITINAQSENGDINICIFSFETGQIQNDPIISSEACNTLGGIPIAQGNVADIGLSEATRQTCPPDFPVAVSDERGPGCSDGEGGFLPFTALGGEGN